MNENTDRVRYEKIDGFAVSSFFVQLEHAGYERKKFIPVSDVSHLERFQYVYNNEKVTLVYDTVAKILTIDAKPSVLADIKKYAPQSKLPTEYIRKEIVAVPPQSEQPAEAKQTAKIKKRPQPGDTAKKKTGKNKPSAPAPVASQGNSQPPASQSAVPPSKTDEGKTAAAGNAGLSAQSESSALSISKFLKNRLEWCIKTIKGLPGVNVKEISDESKSDDQVYQINCGEAKVSLVYAKNQTVTLQGKACGLFEDIKTILTTKSDLRLLKKHLPNGIRYLSESSRIDLSNGITDLAGNVRLSDYSVLLIAPYRALEKLIYDLQQAENINVKMIGQGYEKDDSGKYMLKKGYQKRIGSIVYCEVMSALYTEYFATRNFYTHSDNSSISQTRGLSNKSEAQVILDNLLKVIEYNCKKLTEIGFNIENN